MLAGNNWKVVDKDSVSNWNSQTSLNDSNAKSDLRNKGYHKGFVAEQCPKLGPGWRFWDMTNDLANKTVCNERD
nr:hypothetical protein [Candidatus Mycoplasma haematolamae]